MWHRSDGVPRICIGPHWPCFSVTFGLMFAFLAVDLGMLREMSGLGCPLWQIVLAVFLALVGVISVLFTFLSN